MRSFTSLLTLATLCVTTSAHAGIGGGLYSIHQATGDNPIFGDADVIATNPLSWGKIKARYRD